MYAPPALSTRRPLLHLVKRGKRASPDALVEEIDRAIDGAVPPPVPVLRGTIDEFEDWACEGSTLIRHTAPGGAQPNIQNVPTQLLTAAVRAAFYSLFAAIEVAELTPIAPLA